MASLSFPVVYTVAVEVVEPIDTLASVLTGIPAALVHINITQAALPTVWTETLEGVDPVDAGASVLTWG